MQAHAPDSEAMLALIHACPLAWVVSGTQATPLPLLPETDDEGRLVSFLGHLARSNPQAARFEGGTDGLILFAGPQGYISPKLVADPAWAPTWNYAAARFECRIALVPDETDAALRRLTDEMERVRGNGWSVAQMGARYDELRAHVVAFRAHILAGEGRFKLGQDEPEASFRSIIEGLEDRQLAAWMRRMRGAAEDRK